MKCVGPGNLGEDCCGRPAARGDLCWGHLRQRERHRTLRPIEKLTPEEMVIRDGNDFLEAETEAEFKWRKRKFLLSCERWMLERGWQPPPAPQPRAAPAVVAVAAPSGF